MSPIRIDTDEAFYLSLSHAYDAWDGMVRSVLSASGVSPGEYELLRIAENTPGVTAAAAKKRLRITGPSMSAVVSSLEKKKMIVRMQDTDDARVRHISLTAKGTATIERSRSAFAKVLKDSRIHLPSLASAASSLSSLTSSLLPHVS